mgnify:CR=1 FL=1
MGRFGGPAGRNRFACNVAGRHAAVVKTVKTSHLHLCDHRSVTLAADVFAKHKPQEGRQRRRTLNLFPDDRPVPHDAVETLQVKVSALELRRVRAFGNGWLACELWRQLDLDGFWQQRLHPGRETVAWEKVLTETLFFS